MWRALVCITKQNKKYKRNDEFFGSSTYIADSKSPWVESTIANEQEQEHSLKKTKTKFKIYMATRSLIPVDDRLQGNTAHQRLTAFRVASIVNGSGWMKQRTQCFIWMIFFSSGLAEISIQATFVRILIGREKANQIQWSLERKYHYKSINCAALCVHVYVWLTTLKNIQTPIL